MTSQNGRTYRERAEKSRDSNEFERAARLFTLAAYEHLGECEYTDSRPLVSGGQLGHAIYSLQSAAIDFRKAGRTDRMRNRCQQGILILEDAREHVSEYDAIDGVLTECIADFQMVGSIGDSKETYESARSNYKGADDPTQWQSEPIFQSSIHFMIELGRDLGTPITEAKQLEAMDSFDSRIDLKEQKLPGLLEALDRRWP